MNAASEKFGEGLTYNRPKITQVTGFYKIVINKATNLQGFLIKFKFFISKFASSSLAKKTEFQRVRVRCPSFATNAESD